MRIHVLLEAGLPILAFLLLAGYHLRLLHRMRAAPETTALGVARRVRDVWVELVMAERRDILAVQTLRNWTMAATFLASTAMLIALGILSIAATSARALEVSRLLTFLEGADARFTLIKLMAVAGVFLFAFFNFALAIRYYNHAAYQLALPAGRDPRVTPETVARGLNQGGVHYTLGMRAYYLAVPLALWVFGPELLLGGAVVVLLALARQDRP
ncbi:DUF599 domain-containing protein [Thiohalorhabdus methylotrophus]|uniref:DUF599 domain-containing protein n=1 Tax=Thiohalorhabdus methylotrophus TaxID=3242694 RepID=A0ABV4TVU1_9GAMM